MTQSGEGGYQSIKKESTTTALKVRANTTTTELGAAVDAVVRGASEYPARRTAWGSLVLHEKNCSTWKGEAVEIDNM